MECSTHAQTHTHEQGLGKTTLAHVALKTLGFEIVELNASDERYVPSESVGSLALYPYDSVG